METIKKCRTKGKRNKFYISVNIFVVTLLIWTLQCFNNNDTLNNPSDNDNGYYNGEKTSHKRTKNRCLSQGGGLFGPEINVLKNTVVNYLLGSNNNKDNRGDMKPEVVEPRYDQHPPRNYRDHHYYNGPDDIRGHDSYVIRDGNSHGMPNRQGPEVMSYYVPGDGSEKDRRLQPVYYPVQPAAQRIHYNNNTSMLGYLKHFLLEQQLFSSPVLNKMAPIFFLMFLYYVISAVISNFRHIIALYFLAKIVKLHYNSNN
ncbi:Plasmodium exported protein, unknown function [Plasmodium gonderi]|uniref:Uncharacterized protein n=1 Tax=Plasmodium gonderi TaxID=77519 RepID=A0A1Y1JHW8_PLAGO|nr:Plasmodium exported protein, unknown function [Plasmodium gonderi]GAW80797.1 Plasmodium exported protein, unknown function [Plasmodium gonderi]